MSYNQRHYSPTKQARFEKSKVKAIDDIIRNPQDIDIEDLRRLQMTKRLDEFSAESILKNALQLTLIPTERNRAWRVLMQLAQEERETIIRVIKKPNFFYEFFHDVFMNFKSWSADDSQAGIALFQSVVSKLDLRAIRYIRDHEASLTDSFHHELKLTGRDATEQLVKEMESLLRLTRAKGFLSEDDLDKATCWVHDISDVINLYELAEIAKNKDTRVKDVTNELKMLRRDFEVNLELHAKLEAADRLLKDENLQLQKELDKFKHSLDDSTLKHNKTESENERLKNKLRMAHNELRKKLDESLLDL